jgi:GNAT superfamily N-acetyltransferase
MPSMNDPSLWTVLPASERPVDVADLLILFQAEGWWPRCTEGAMAEVIAAGPAVGAWVGERLVGFARAVTDGAFRAYVEDVVVAESARRSGVARGLVEALLEQLPAGAVVSLFCSPDLQALYAGVDFKPTRQLVMHRELPA